MEEISTNGTLHEQISLFVSQETIGCIFPFEPSAWTNSPKFLERLDCSLNENNGIISQLLQGSTVPKEKVQQLKQLTREKTNEHLDAILSQKDFLEAYDGLPPDDTYHLGVI